MSSVTARLNNLRVAPRKVRLVANLLKGMPVDDAVSQLQFMAKASARPLQKLLQTAAADAEHNFQLVKDDLVVKSVVVNAAQTYKRFMPRAFGSAGMIRKRGSNVIVTLESRTGAKVQKTEKAKDEKASSEKADKSQKRVHDHDHDPSFKQGEKHRRRFFNRKSG